MNVNKFIDTKIGSGVSEDKHKKADNDKHLVVDELRNVQSRIGNAWYVVDKRKHNPRARYRASKKPQKQARTDYKERVRKEKRE